MLDIKKPLHWGTPLSGQCYKSSLILILFDRIFNVVIMKHQCILHMPLGFIGVSWLASWKFHINQSDTRKTCNVGNNANSCGTIVHRSLNRQIFLNLQTLLNKIFVSSDWVLLWWMTKYWKLYDDIKIQPQQRLNIRVYSIEVQRILAIISCRDF